MARISLSPALIGRVLRGAWTGRNLWHRLARPLTMGVRAILIDRDSQHGDRVLLIRHSYVDGWHLPGGGVDRNESMVEAVRREVREEVGLTVLACASQPRSIHARFRNGASDHVGLFVIDEWSGTPKADRVEILEARFFTLTDLPDGVTAATKRRLEEYASGRQGDPLW